MNGRRDALEMLTLSVLAKMAQRGLMPPALLEEVAVEAERLANGPELATFRDMQMEVAMLARLALAWATDSDRTNVHPEVIDALPRN